MGQRHQVFVIARLIPHGSKTGQAHYRCIGVRHHQWCYGTLPLRATHRFLCLIKNENNAKIIRDELRRTQYMYGRIEETPKMPLMPCPYTLLLLAQAWDADLGDLENPYASGVGFEYNSFHPDTGSFGIQNDDGITVIDVTDPADPAYCFIKYSCSGPVDMRDYVRKYYDLSGMERKVKSAESNEDLEPMTDRVLKVVSDFEGIRVITTEMLAEVWPNEYISHTRIAESTNTASDAADITETRTLEAVPSLVNLSIPPAVENALTNNDTEKLEELVWMSDKADLIKKVLITKDPFPDSGLPLLIKILTYELKSSVTVDLSMFPSLTSTQITSMIIAFPNIKSLNLSGNQNIGPETISSILTTLPNLLRLVLLNTSLSGDQLLSLLSTSPQLFFHLHDLIHPVLLQHHIPARSDPRSPSTKSLHPAYKHGITVITLAASNPMISFASVPFFNAEKLLKSLVRPLSLLNSADGKNENPYFGNEYMQSRLGGLLALSEGSVDIASDGISGPASISHTYSTRSISCVPYTDSHDCLIGIGWMFIITADMFGSFSGMGPIYGFVKVDEEALERKLKKAVTKKAQTDDEGKEWQEEKPEGVNGESGTLPDDSKKSTTTESALMQETSELHPPWLKIYDVRGFINEMQKEGRPIPSEETIKEFETALGSPLTEAEEEKIAEAEAILQKASSYPSNVRTEALNITIKRRKMARLMTHKGFEGVQRSTQFAALWERY